MKKILLSAFLLLIMSLVSSTPGSLKTTQEQIIGEGDGYYICLEKSWENDGTYYYQKETWSVLKKRIGTDEIIERNVFKIMETEDTTTNGDWVERTLLYSSPDEFMNFEYIAPVYLASTLTFDIVAQEQAGNSLHLLLEMMKDDSYYEIYLPIPDYADLSHAEVKIIYESGSNYYFILADWCNSIIISVDNKTFWDNVNMWQESRMIF